MTDPGKRKLLSQINHALGDFGSLLTLDDLIELAREHRMWLGHRNNTVIAAEIIPYPQRTVCNFVVAAGDLADVLALEDEAISFARSQGASLMVTHGRRAWTRIGAPRGWQARSIEYIKWLPPSGGHA
jgi:hypothetical protein